MLGDLNIDLSTDRLLADKTQLSNFVNDLNLSILPLNLTHHRPTSDTWLDLIITNDRSKIFNHGQISISGFSYHDLIYL